MPTMRNTGDHRRTVRRGPSLYVAEAGETIEVRASDVDRLSGYGFELVEEDDPSDLENRSKAELLELAAERDVEGRSSMTKAELVSALSTPEA